MSDAAVFTRFSPAELTQWLVQTRTAYVEARTAAGDSAEEAEANAERTLSRLVPGGSPGPGQHIGHVVVHDEPVGVLWVGPEGTDPQRWWVWDVVIDDDRRGQGLGRQAMLLAERLARAQGARTIGLNVFARNTVARALYGSLGYQETAVQMRKEL